MSKTDPIRVVIVDDHPLAQSGLRNFVESFGDFELVEAVSSGEEAIACCERAQPDVVLLDLLMPGMDGVTATRAIKQRWPKIQVVALSSSQDSELVAQALQGGPAIAGEALQLGETATQPGNQLRIGRSLHVPINPTVQIYRLTLDRGREQALPEWPTAAVGIGVGRTRPEPHPTTGLGKARGKPVEQRECGQPGSPPCPVRDVRDVGVEAEGLVEQRGARAGRAHQEQRRGLRYLGSDWLMR